MLDLANLESEKHAIGISSKLKDITSELGINLIYKTSFDKANRTSLKGKRGLGLENHSQYLIK